MAAFAPCCAWNVVLRLATRRATVMAIGAGPVHIRMVEPERFPVVRRVTGRTFLRCRWVFDGFARSQFVVVTGLTCLRCAAQLSIDMARFTLSLFVRPDKGEIRCIVVEARKHQFHWNRRALELLCGG